MNLITQNIKYSYVLNDVEEEELEENKATKIIQEFLEKKECLW